MYAPADTGQSTLNGLQPMTSPSHIGPVAAAVSVSTEPETEPVKFDFMQASSAH